LLNLAGLEPQYFRAILDGRKQTERRTRKRIDPALERVRPTEAVILFICNAISPALNPPLCRSSSATDLFPSACQIRDARSTLS
jgi:hypothetical protein